MGRIGPVRQFEQEASLHDYTNNTGMGLMGIPDPNYLPKELIEFCLSQYDRFNIPRPHQNVIEVGAWATYFALDFSDPYALLMGVSDVNYTHDWQSYTYEIKDPNTGRIIEARNVEMLETFSVMQNGQAEVAFNHYMSHPGFESMPDYLVEHITLCLDGEWNSEGDAVAQLSQEAEMDLRALCAKEDGTVDGAKAMNYFKVAAWAAWCWFIGPPSRDFRYDHHDVFHTCFTHGECIIYEGFIFDPTQYKKIDRPPQSCAICGLDAWCVEMAQIGGSTRFLCEHHLNGDLPLYGTATCGSKACRYVECQYHPYFGKNGGLASTLRKTGQLFSMARDGGTTALPGAQEQLKLT